IYLRINHNLLPMIEKYVILKVRKFLPYNKNMKITSKGQVTIPVEIREKLGLTPNTEVEFEVIGDSVYLKKATVKPTPGKSLVEMMRGKATVKMTTDEIMTLTRQD
ncbi:MAG: AbrB/MazE/SpoVT family DNA-binding domain-containing protein, partial [Cuspidothrix sp.]